MSRFWIRCLSLLAPATLSTASSAELPAAVAKATLVTEDCVSVHADGEPWQECGVQAFDMDEAGSRILAVTATGIVQLWNENGAELLRLDWSDQPSGASGYPTAHVAVVGAYGVAVTHQNQLVVLDLASGKVVTQRVLDAMKVDRLMRFGRGRVLVEYKDRSWDRGAGEIALPSGDVSKLPGLTDLTQVGPTYWVSGTRPPFKLHRPLAAMPELPLVRSCAPLDEAYCTWRDTPGDRVHVLDVARATWTDYDLGRTLENSDSLDIVRVGISFLAVTCGRSTESQPYLRRCSVRNLAGKRDLLVFQASHVRAVGAVGPNGAPEIRMMISVGSRREALAVSADGVVRFVDHTGAAALSAPLGGVVVPAEQQGESYLLDRQGRTVARLPFQAQTCGNGWPTWTGGCRTSADGHRWLVPAETPSGDPQDEKVHLTLYELPATVSAVRPN